jgi:hypothetical protein
MSDVSLAAILVTTVAVVASRRPSGRLVELSVEPQLRLA